jgi:DUF2075 family protein
LEFDYVGVIIGPDIRYDGKKIVTDASKRAKTDKSLSGLGKYAKDKQIQIADRIIKDTYKVLMTRGMKGCYVYCVDKGMTKYLREMSGQITLG